MAPHLMRIPGLMGGVDSHHRTKEVGIKSMIIRNGNRNVTINAGFLTGK
jgi:hypothetical protein